MSFYLSEKNKKKPSTFKMLPQLAPCICGRMKFHRVKENGLIKVTCDCGQEGPWGKHEWEARINWNRLMENLNGNQPW